MSTKTKNKRRAWSPAEKRSLKGFARKKTPTPTIARKLKRSASAVRQMAHTLGCSLSTQNRSRKTLKHTAKRPTPKHQPQKLAA